MLGNPRVLFCGSRDWPVFDDDKIRNRIGELHPESIVMHGGTPGADYWAGFWAKQRGLRVEVYKADWKTHGKKAGPLRNRQMLDKAPSMIVAFKSALVSRGTDDTINEARKRGFPVEVHTL